MIFNSIAFQLFFCIVSLLYFLTPHKYRWGLLLAASYYFYISLKAEYAAILFATSSVTYLCALLMHLHARPSFKKALLIAGLSLNVGILCVFKYTGFIFSSLQDAMHFFSIQTSLPTITIILPVGISFYVFRTISYLLEVYRGNMKPERHFGIFSLYVSFFPSLLAGPIDRAVTLIPQFYKKSEFDAARFLTGVQLILWGLFKKVVIADRLALYVDSVFNNVPHHQGLSFIVATYLYTFQIYCDFSGYSDIAIGCASILGLDLMQNFNLPYFSTTITEFWRRWHISLSTWFRDYLYIPLGGNRKGLLRTCANLMLTMSVCGLWHGANWTFILWGTLHGFFLCLSRLTLQLRNQCTAFLKIPSALVAFVRVVITFNLVAFLWIFFRASTIRDAVHIVLNLFCGWPKLFVESSTLAHGALGISILITVELCRKLNIVKISMRQWHCAFQYLIVCLLIFSIILFGVDSGSQFIYFQF